VHSTLISFECTRTSFRNFFIDLRRRMSASSLFYMNIVKLKKKEEEVLRIYELCTYVCPCRNISGGRRFRDTSAQVPKQPKYKYGTMISLSSRYESRGTDISRGLPLMSRRTREATIIFLPDYTWPIRMTTSLNQPWYCHEVFVMLKRVNRVINLQSLLRYRLYMLNIIT